MEVIRNPTRSLHPWFKCLTRRTSMWRLRHVTADNTKMTTKTTCLHVQFSVPCWTVFTSLKTRSKLEERKRLQIFSPWTGNLQHCPVPSTAECTKGFVCGCCGTKVSSKKTLWVLVPFAVHFFQPFIGDSLESVYIKWKTSNKKITWGRQKIVYVAWLYVTQGDKVSRPVSPQSFGRLPRFVRTFRASAKYSVVEKEEKVGKAFISVQLEESSKNLN